MRPSLRFLAMAVVGWAGIRAATLGMIPGAQLFAAKPDGEMQPAAAQAAGVEPIAPASVTPEPYQAAMPYPPQYYPYPPQYLPYPLGGAAGPVSPIVIPVEYSYRAPPQSTAQPAIWSLPEPRRYYSPEPPGADWEVSSVAASSMPVPPTASEPPQSTPAATTLAHRLDRIQLTMWAALRGRQDLSGTTSLASGGTLGGSQAGARLFYNVTPQIAAVLRSSSDVNRRGGELAAGVRVQPLRSIPLWVTAERRFQLGRYGGGRNAFALFAEGGVYDRPMPWNFTLDGYAQAGVVGLSSRDLFADGAATFTRPVYKQFSGGFGVWGGVQPGLYRVDAGPRVTIRVRRNVKVHVDWRQRLAGNAEPGSGPVLTLAGDF